MTVPVTSTTIVLRPPFETRLVDPKTGMMEWAWQEYFRAVQLQLGDSASRIAALGGGSGNNFFPSS